MKLGILANLSKPSAPAVLREAQLTASRLGIDLFVTGLTSSILPGATELEEPAFVASIDVLMVLGGDGSLLSAVNLLNGADKPIMGVNLGRLGFMTSVPEDRISLALECLASGEITESARALLECHHARANSHAQYRALNDVVVGWGGSSRTAKIVLDINGETVTTYICDGIICSTPTGSTGHSLSSGGPIIHPETPALVITVICPHTLSMRPLIVPAESRIRMCLADASKDLLLSVDGRPAGPVEPGDFLELHTSAHRVRLLHLPGYSYYDVLRTKLGWRGSSIHS